MAQILEGPDTRFRDILFNEYGSGVDFTTQAQTASIPTGRFYPFDGDYSIEDSRCPLSESDRRVQLDWDEADELENAPINENDSKSLETYILTVSNCVVYGPDAGTYLKAAGSEDKASIKKYQRAKRRAQGDAKRIRRALQFKELHGSDTSPQILSVMRIAPTSIVRIESDKGSRLLAVTKFSVLLEVDNESDYDP